MQPMSFSEFKNLAKVATKIAVFEEIPAGNLHPELIYSLLTQICGNGVLFEDLYSVESKRYSYMCFEPLASLSIQQGSKEHPIPALRKFKSDHHVETRKDVAHLITNTVGFFTYNAVCYFENIPDRHAKDHELPVCLFNTYALNLTFDHSKQSILISYSVTISGNLNKIYRKAKQKIQDIIYFLSSYHDSASFIEEEKVSSLPIQPDMLDVDFIRMVKKAKDYITQGDAFQIVLSRCFKQNYAVSPFSIYKSLRKTSPSPFMFYFPTPSYVILTASPERLISIYDGTVNINPIAGTRKHINGTSKADITNDLLSDKKELAEHMMLVDLARNDIGVVCRPDSVQVEKLLQVKHFSHVSHITSTVTGRLENGCDALDAFQAAFPAGTLSGAPKIRSMQIIDEIETTGRGLYGGAICRFDLAGNFDSCIAIRMAILQDGIAHIRAGAGIVYDSNPETEVAETLQKARPIIDAIIAAHGG